MPKYYEDKEEDTRACAGVREDFKACLLEHDCVRKASARRPLRARHLGAVNVSSYSCREGKLPSECLREGHCRALQTSFFECKRSMLDNRSRFRGRKGY
ncbi:Cytochrome c oxidase assembly factor 5 [Liparis tanakae]|uniref:Cytochrome c oxidase assembly factor 5 n=1 Tax=Liparis tanakae TaxID=230148 RepID=A0A4Z2HM32_9TELE|nr:Cytochrome c oxidase assembly factor 5 [Liparis tanakae]